MVNGNRYGLNFMSPYIVKKSEKTDSHVNSSKKIFFISWEA
jgi:hypothetical protein